MIFGKSPCLKIGSLSFSNTWQARIVWFLVRLHARVLTSLLVDLFFLHKFEVFQYLLWVVATGAHRPADERLRCVGVRHRRHLSAQRMLDQSVLFSANLSDAVIVFVVTHARWEVILTRRRCHLTHFASKMTDFARQSWHKSISFRVVSLLFQVFRKLVLWLLFSLAESVFQELLSAPLLHGLLLKDVLEQIFVALD